MTHHHLPHVVEPPRSRRGCHQLAEDDGDEGTREMNENLLPIPELARQ